MEKLARSPKFLQQKIQPFPYILSNSKYKFLKSFGKKIRKISHSSIESLYNDELSRWRPDEGMYEKNFEIKAILTKFLIIEFLIYQTIDT